LKQKFLPPLTGIRGLTIMWMVVFHLHNTYGVVGVLLPGLNGFAAVTSGVKFRMDLLFMLSGFLISYIYIANRAKLTLQAYGGFLRSRLVRLYPVYIASFLLRGFLKGLTSATASPEFRIGLLLILGGFLVACVLVAKRIEATLRVSGGLMPSRRTGILLTIVLASTLVLGSTAIVMHLGAVLGGNPTWMIIPTWLVMVQAWPWVPRFGRVLGSVWFLSSLWFAYIFLFPVAWRLVHGLRSIWSALLWIFVPLIIWLTVSEVPSLEEIRFVTRASCGFLCGSALFVLYTKRSALIAAAQKYLDVTVLLFLASSVLIPKVQSEAASRDINFLLLLAVPFLLAGNTATRSYTSKFLASRPMLWLGRISYSLFMSHTISIELWELVLPCGRYANSSLLVRVLIVVTYYAFVLLAAAGLYYFVEAPWEAALNAYSARRQKAPAPTSPLTATGVAQNPSC
jgi:peptidoglycan/LPS O-acetylase OafA/YrhL